MNLRAALHAVVAACLAISAGTVVLAGLPEVWAHNVVATSALIGIVLETYLASTSTGESIAKARR